LTFMRQRAGRTGPKTREGLIAWEKGGSRRGSSIKRKLGPRGEKPRKRDQKEALIRRKRKKDPRKAKTFWTNSAKIEKTKENT